MSFNTYVSRVRSEFPCKGCADRKVGCHGSCEKYLSVRKEHDKKIEEKNREAQLKWDVDCYITDRVTRISKNIANVPVRKKKVKE